MNRVARVALRAPTSLGVLLGALLGAVELPAAEPTCDVRPTVYCNDFESGAWQGMEHEADASLVTGGVPGLTTFEGQGGVLAVLDTDADGASFGFRFAGAERIFVRFYMKWDTSWDRPMHHFFAVHGDRADDIWSCHGTAGCRPNGLLCLNGSTVDTRETVVGQLPGEPFFYTYFPDMQCDPGPVCANYADPVAICAGCALRGLPCDNGLECCWGNHFDPNQGISISMEQDRWYAVETMIRANSVGGGSGVGNGAMALWIDGELVAHHTGLLWRHDDELLLNHFVVWNYFPEATTTYRIWFDNLVIATTHIGTWAELVFADGFESGDTGAWTATVP